MNYHQYKLAKQLIIEDCKRYENYNGFRSILKRFLLYPAFKVLVFHRLLTSFGLVGGGIFFFLPAYGFKIFNRYSSGYKNWRGLVDVAWRPNCH